MPSKNTFILNPKTGDYVFGIIPEINYRGDFFPEGEIKLRHGEHKGPNRGFGVTHIWAEHAKELTDKGYVNIDDVAKYLSDLIGPGSPIYCEFNSMRGNHRIAVLRSSVGVVFLEQKSDAYNNIFYSVVTAFRKTKAHGTRIGSVC